MIDRRQFLTGAATAAASVVSGCGDKRKRDKNLPPISFSAECGSETHSLHFRINDDACPEDSRIVFTRDAVLLLDARGRALQNLPFALSGDKPAQVFFSKTTSRMMEIAIDMEEFDRPPLRMPLSFSFLHSDGEEQGKSPAMADDEGFQVNISRAGYGCMANGRPGVTLSVDGCYTPPVHIEGMSASRIARLNQKDAIARRQDMKDSPIEIDLRGVMVHFIPMGREIPHNLFIHTAGMRPLDAQDIVYRLQHPEAVRSR